MLRSQNSFDLSLGKVLINRFNQGVDAKLMLTFKLCYAGGGTNLLGME